MSNLTFPFMLVEIGSERRHINKSIYRLPKRLPAAKGRQQENPQMFNASE
ncbi:hypothetical protein PO002_44960 [Cupriavidus necator]